MLNHWYLTICLGLAASHLALRVVADPAAATTTSLPLRIDHQFRAPGDPNGVFDSRFNDAEVLLDLGYNAQAGRYAEATVPFATLAGGPFYPAGSTGRTWMDAHAAALREEMSEMKTAGLVVLNHIDFILLPKAVVDAYAAQICVPPKTAAPCSLQFNDVMVKILDVMFTELFAMYPDLDGVIIRFVIIGNMLYVIYVVQVVSNGVATCSSFTRTGRLTRNHDCVCVLTTLPW
jgi:hypothetical protein